MEPALLGLMGQPELPAPGVRVVPAGVVLETQPELAGQWGQP